MSPPERVPWNPTRETDTITDCDAVPPEPVHVNTYSVDVLSGWVVCVPLVASEPLQPPEAVHAVAFVELHDNIDV
jgi:hypothetical protein